jgi:hypothetical protein
VEIKFNQRVEIALKQIEEKKYFQPFLHKGKKIRLLGMSFLRKTGKKAHFTVEIESKLLS